MLSRSWSAHRAHYDFLIIGSGYGGAIAAARLATAKVSPRPSICVLERGREWPIGSFPDTVPEILRERRGPLNPRRPERRSIPRRRWSRSAGGRAAAGACTDRGERAVKRAVRDDGRQCHSCGRVDQFHGNPPSIGKRGLSVSPKVGSNFSGNGDFFGLAYNGSHRTNVCGFGNHPDARAAAFAPGPTIVGGIRYPDNRLEQSMLIEDLSFASASVDTARFALALLRGEDTERWRPRQGSAPGAAGCRAVHVAASRWRAQSHDGVPVYGL